MAYMLVPPLQGCRPWSCCHTRQRRKIWVFFPFSVGGRKIWVAWTDKNPPVINHSILISDERATGMNKLTFMMNMTADAKWQTSTPWRYSWMSLRRIVNTTGQKIILKTACATPCFVGVIMVHDMAIVRVVVTCKKWISGPRVCKHRICIERS